TGRITPHCSFCAIRKEGRVSAKNPFRSSARPARSARSFPCLCQPGLSLGLVLLLYVRHPRPVNGCPPWRHYLSYKESSAANCTGLAKNRALAQVPYRPAERGAGPCQGGPPACLGVLFQLPCLSVTK